MARAKPELRPRGIADGPVAASPNAINESEPNQRQGRANERLISFREFEGTAYSTECSKINSLVSSISDCIFPLLLFCKCSSKSRVILG
jgi:hypothetical protein